jgi:hypothetical protein
MDNMSLQIMRIVVSEENLMLFLCHETEGVANALRDFDLA